MVKFEEKSSVAKTEETRRVVEVHIQIKWAHVAEKEQKVDEKRPAGMYAGA